MTHLSKSDLDTIISGLYGEEKLMHPFMPILALEIGLANSVLLETRDVEKIKALISQKLKGNLLAWSDNYPPDYDSTITAHNVFQLLGFNIPKINFSYAENGGIYTYHGGVNSKLNNNVDLVINARILEYIINNESNYSAEDKDELATFLSDKKDEFYEDVKKLSKYYLSNGFMEYTLRNINSVIGIDMCKLIKTYIPKQNNKTDIALSILAANKLNDKRKKEEIISELIQKYESADASPLQLFCHPRLSLKFSCGYFDEIVRKIIETYRNINLILPVRLQQ